MISVSDAFKAAVEAPVRNWRTRVLLEMSGSDVQLPSTNGAALDGDLFPSAQAANGVKVTTYKYAFPSERVFPSDPTDPDEPPLMPPDPSYECGFWDEQFSDENGDLADDAIIELEYTTPFPSIDHVGVYFDGWLGYAVAFSVELYHDGGWDVIFATDDNALTSMDIVLDAPVADVEKVRLVATKLQYADENLRVIELDAAWVEDITQKVKSWSVRKERYFSGNELPMPSASANQLTLVLDNQNDIFWTRNESSPYYGMLKANQRCWLNIDLQIAGLWETVPIGVFYTTKWSTKRSDVVTTITLLDRGKRLMETTFATSEVLFDKKISEIAAVLLADAGVPETEYDIDDTGDDSVVPYYWSERVTHWDALCTLYGAEGGKVYVDEYDRVICQSREALTAGDLVATLTSETHFSDLVDEWDEALMRNAIILKANPLLPRPLEEVEIYKNAEEEGAGSLVVTFDYASNDVRDPTILAGVTGATAVWASAPSATGGTITVTGTIPANKLVVRGKPQKFIVWKNGESRTLAAAEELEIEVFFDDIPVIECDDPAFVVRDGEGLIIATPAGLTAEWKNGKVYGFGGVVLITNGTGSSQTIADSDLWVRGTPLERNTQEIVTVKDDELIRKNRRREFEYTNPLLQSRTLAESLGNFLLQQYGDPVSPIRLEMPVRGMPHLQLSDYVRVVDPMSHIDHYMWVTGIDLQFDGALNGAIELIVGGDFMTYPWLMENPPPDLPTGLG